MIVGTPFVRWKRHDCASSLLNLAGLRTIQHVPWNVSALSMGCQTLFPRASSPESKSSSPQNAYKRSTRNSPPSPRTTTSRTGFEVRPNRMSHTLYTPHPMYNPRTDSNHIILKEDQRPFRTRVLFVFLTWGCAPGHIPPPLRGEDLRPWVNHGPTIKNNDRKITKSPPPSPRLPSFAKATARQAAGRLAHERTGGRDGSAACSTFALLRSRVSFAG